MGSEMCIRDRARLFAAVYAAVLGAARIKRQRMLLQLEAQRGGHGCLLYTSDAADERSSVDLGGRRIIKKKKAAHTRRERVRCRYSRSKIYIQQRDRKSDT